LESSFDIHTFLYHLIGGHHPRILGEPLTLNAAALRDQLSGTYEFINLGDPQRHGSLTDLGISNRFLERVATPQAAKQSFQRDVAIPLCRDILENRNFSPRVIDAIIATRTQSKFSISPWTGEFIATRDSLGPLWYLFRHQASGFIVGQLSAPELQFHDTIWVLPQIKKVLFVESGMPEPRIIQGCADLAARLVKRLPEVVHYLCSNIRKTVIYDWQCEHFGHYVWNVISAWGALFEIVPPLDLSTILCVDTTKYFGPISEIFGDGRNNISERSVKNLEQVYDIIFAEFCFISSINHSYITRYTADKIVEHSMRLVDPDFAMKLLSIKKNNWPVLLLGLRFDNRSWVDQLTGFAEIISRVRSDFPDAAFVIQGLSKGVAMGSTSAWMSLDVDVAASKELERTLGDPDYVLSAVGRSIHENVAISNLCDAFLAPIGSGMALYKWLTNKPGVAFSNRYCMDPANPRRWAFTVFDRYRDDIIASVPIPLSAVTDTEADHHGSPSRPNFTLDRDVLYETLRDLLLSLPRPERLD